MKTVGFVRKVDELGRAVLPQAMRVIIKIKKKEKLEMFKENDTIYVCKQGKKSINDNDIQSSTIIIRQIDDLGRIVIPKEWRDELDIKFGDELEIGLKGEMFALKKYIPYCIFCGNEENLINYEEKLVCNDCIKKLNKIKK